IHKLRFSSWTFFFTFIFACSLHAAETGISVKGGVVDYLEPKVLTGTVYADDSLKRVLFTFRRSATNSGSTINVVREFYLPDGKVAARERVAYEGNQLKSFQLEELQTGAKGSTVVQADGNKMNFDYVEGSTRKTGTEKFSP